jgi:trimeric autotransporter adhesin
MRATEGYVAGVGTTSALMGAIGCAFALLTTVVAVHGWPLELSTPGPATVEDHGGMEGALPPVGLFPAFRRAVPAGGAGRPVQTGPRPGIAPARMGPVASAFGQPAGATRRPADGRTPSVGPAAGAAGKTLAADAAPATPTPVPRGDAGPGSDGPPAASPPSDGGSSTTLGGTVVQVTSGAGTAVALTGQQLGSAVQGTTGQLGGAVGQVSPTAGKTVTQTGQVVGGVVSGATSATGQVVAGAGATAGRLLGGLGGG